MSSAASAVPFEECPAATREVWVLALACSTLGTVLPPQAVRATTATAVSVETGISLCIATSLRSALADAGGARVPRAEPLLQDAVDETCCGVPIAGIRRSALLAGDAVAHRVGAVYGARSASA